MFLVRSSVLAFLWFAISSAVLAGVMCHQGHVDPRHLSTSLHQDQLGAASVDTAENAAKVQPHLIPDAIL